MLIDDQQEDLGRARALVIPREQKSMIDQEPQIIQQPTREPANTSVGNTGGVGVDMDF